MPTTSKSQLPASPPTKIAAAATQPVPPAHLPRSAGPRASFLQGAAWQRMALASAVLGALWLVLLASLSAAD